MRSNLLKAELVKRNITQTELARRLGISPQALSNQLRTGKMGVERAEQIIKLIGLSPEQAINIFLPNI
jgi:transcriptional regulator with XRE-family HTH domain